MSAVFVDLPALAQSLQQVPLHQRLDLEAELVQVGRLTAFPKLKKKVTTNLSIVFRFLMLRISLHAVAVIFPPLIPFQVSTPVDLPTMTFTPKQEMTKATAFTPPSAALKVLSTDHKVPVATNPASVPDSQVSSSTAESPPVDDDEDDEELDQLLSLQKPVLDVSGNQSPSIADEESSVPEKGECIQQALFELFIISPQLKGVTQHFGKYSLWWRLR